MKQHFRMYVRYPITDWARKNSSVPPAYSDLNCPKPFLISLILGVVDACILGLLIAYRATQTMKNLYC